MTCRWFFWLAFQINVYEFSIWTNEQEASGHTFHLGYAVALLNGFVAFVLSLWQQIFEWHFLANPQLLVQITSSRVTLST